MITCAQNRSLPMGCKDPFAIGPCWNYCQFYKYELPRDTYTDEDVIREYTDGTYKNVYVCRTLNPKTADCQHIKNIEYLMNDKRCKHKTGKLFLHLSYYRKTGLREYITVIHSITGWIHHKDNSWEKVTYDKSGMAQGELSRESIR